MGETRQSTMGNESRVTMLSENIAEELKINFQSVKIIHQQDLQKGYGSIYLPFALERKYPEPSMIGFGSLFFLLEASLKTPVVVKFVITFTILVYKKR
ncbi:hypothetical protein [Nostoc sp.]|uniref:hypothetical protein n=1 Tax=Nostoc sp. TaxID=1180 RepID=UPI002FFD0DDF